MATPTAPTTMSTAPTAPTAPTDPTDPEGYLQKAIQTFRRLFGGVFKRKQVEKPVRSPAPDTVGPDEDVTGEDATHEDVTGDEDATHEDTTHEDVTGDDATRNSLKVFFDLPTKYYAVPNKYEGFAKCKKCSLPVQAGFCATMATSGYDRNCCCDDREHLVGTLNEYLLKKYQQALARRISLVPVREDAPPLTPEDPSASVSLHEQPLTPEDVPTFSAEEPCAPWTPPKPTKKQEEQRIKDSNLCRGCDRTILAHNGLGASNYGDPCPNDGKCKVQGPDEE